MSIKKKATSQRELWRELQRLRERVAEWETVGAIRQEGEQRYREMVESTHDLIQSVGPEGRLLFANRAWRETLGYTGNDLTALNVFDIIHPDSRAHCEDIFARVMSSEAVNNMQVTFVKRDGTPVFLEGTVNAMLRDGHVVATHGFFRNITERQQAEAWRQQPEFSITEISADGDTRYGAFIRDVSEKVCLQEQMVERERLAAIGTTAAILAHEVGNSLNSMSLNAQLLERRLAKSSEGLDARLRGYVGNMKRELTRLTNLLHEFRSASRRQPFTFRPLNLAALIQELLAVETPYYTDRGVQVENLIPDDLPPVQADGNKLKQVFLNLCKNAVEAMSAGGTLTLRAQHAAERVTIEVRDTGDGIPEGVNVFELFATTKAEGTGLGLPIVQQIITAHGGTLSYTSAPRQGTNFIVALPLSPPHVTP